MPKVAAAHCNPKVKPKLNHNDRTNDTAQTITKELSHLNEIDTPSNKVRERIDKLYAQAEKNYYAYCEKKNGLAKSGKPKGLQNFTKKDKCYHEFIYELDSQSTMEQCQDLTKQIAELTGFTPLQVAIHRDEVFKDERGETKTHYHAHAVFFTLDKDGLQLARREASLHKGNLSKIQTLTATALKMKRGENRYEQGIAQPKYIQDYKDYANFKDQETKLLKEMNDKKRLNELENEKERQRIKTQALAEIDEIKRLNEREMQEKRKALDEQQKAINDKVAEIELGHEKALRKLDISFNKRKSLIKNLLTFGKYNARIEKDRQEARKALISSFNEQDNALKNQLSTIEKDFKDLKDKHQQLEKDFEKMTNFYENELENKEKTIEYMKNRAKNIKEFCEKHLSAEARNVFLKEFYPQSLEKEISKQKTHQQGIQRG